MNKVSKILSVAALLAIGGGATLNATENDRLMSAQQGVENAQNDLAEAKEKLRKLEEEYRQAPESKKAALKKEIQAQRQAVKEAQRDNKTAVKTLKKAANKNNQSGAFFGGEVTVGYANTTPNAMSNAVTVKDGFALSGDFDLKGGYKFYFNDVLGVRAHAGLGYGTRITALTISGGSNDDFTYQTSGFKVSLGADLLLSPSGGFGIFAGGGVDIYKWSDDASVAGTSVTSTVSGVTSIPKFQVGMRFGGFEIAGVFNTSAIQPSHKGMPNITYGNTKALKLGYYYSF